MTNKNVVLITIDSLRKDHCSCYGYNRPTTPFIDSIARDGVIFSQACAVGSLTPRSFPGILCGIYPFDGKHDVLDYSLPQNHTAIAETMQSFGYDTAAIQAGNPFISKYYGYDRGFDYFEDFIDLTEAQTVSDPPLRARIISTISKYIVKVPFIYSKMKHMYYFLSSRKRMIKIDSKQYLHKLKTNDLPFTRGDKINDVLYEWLLMNDTRRPLFLWVHFMDVHQPFIPDPECADAIGVQQYSQSKIAHHWSNITTHNINSQRQITELIDLYDCEIRYADNQLKTLFIQLDLFGINKENTLFIITSDHGEEFGEHGGLGHELKLYNEMLSIPLILFGSGSEKYAPDADTLIDHRCIPNIISNIPTESKASMYNKYLIAESLRKDASGYVRIISVQTRKYKLIHDTKTLDNEFYVLKNDPYEQRSQHANVDYIETILAYLHLAYLFSVEHNDAGAGFCKHKTYVEHDKIRARYGHDRENNN